MVGTPSRLAASGALRSSAAISASNGSTKPEFTAESGDFVLDLGQNRQVIRRQQGLPGVFQRRKELEGLLKFVVNPGGRFYRRVQVRIAGGTVEPEEPDTMASH